MYEQHFGLKKRPFRATASGANVFVGPHLVALLAGLKQALTSNDSIVTVSGPVGSGKTTLVGRALGSLGGNRKFIPIARMRLDSDDVLEFLLDELGVTEKPRGTIQRFSLFRRQLRELATNDITVFIVIEDAVRLGADTLAEIEALTANDAGESDGAGVLFMGDETLEALLREPELARLQQRVKLRHTVTPLCTDELRGYFRHCFRLAGREFEELFEANAADLLHQLTNGIPRIANNLIESAMRAAADQDAAKVSTELLARIAENEFGLSAAAFEQSQNSAPASVQPAPPVQPAAPEPVVVSEIAADEPVLVFAKPGDNATEQEDAEADIPELIQDTLPDLEILAPELAVIAQDPEPEPEPVPVPVPEPEPEALPVLPVQGKLSPPADSSGDEVPEWDRDPTVAELRPDLAALEQAMAFAQGDNAEPSKDESEPLPIPKPKEPEVIPEITLDHAISQRIENNLIDEPGEVSAPPAEKATATEKPNASTNGLIAPAPSSPPKRDKKADAELEKIAIELAKAKTIEDVDDKLAETLFGEELNFIATQVLANPPLAEPANEDLQAAVATGQVVTNGSTDADDAPKQLDDGGMDLSVSQRLKTVRALNADSRPAIREPEAAVESKPSATATARETPDSIEDQITSMTQTLKALDVTPPIIDFDDDDEGKGGFFSRFKRS